MYDYLDSEDGGCIFSEICQTFSQNTMPHAIRSHCYPLVVHCVVVSSKLALCKLPFSLISLVTFPGPCGPVTSSYFL